MRKLKRVYKLLFVVVAVVVASADTATPVLAEEITEDNIVDDVVVEPTPTPDFFEPTPIPDISGESESLGEFNSGESDVDDMYQKLLDALEGVNFDTVDKDAGADAEATPVPDEENLSEYEENLNELDDSVEPYANYDVYYGSIGTQYVEYMRGYLPKLGFREHYVGARVSQYQYIFAWGEDLSFDGTNFHGSGVDVITWTTNNNGTFSHSVQSSFNLFPGAYLVYSDLGEVYPSLADLSAFTLRQVLILACIVALVCTMSSMYQVRKVRKLGLH